MFSKISFHVHKWVRKNENLLIKIYSSTFNMTKLNREHTDKNKFMGSYYWQLEYQ